MSFERHFPALAASLGSLREAVGAYAREVGASASTAVHAVQAVHEAAANAIVHGYRGGDDAQAVSVEGAAVDGFPSPEDLLGDDVKWTTLVPRTPCLLYTSPSPRD